MAVSQSLLLLVAFLSVVVVLLVDAGVVRDDPDTKIIGGHVVKIEEVPWQVFLRMQKSASPSPYRCGGSIISDRWVISAAHCTQGYEPCDVTMLIGTNSAEDDQHTYHAEKVISHKFTWCKPVNDISLVKTKTVLNLDGHPLKAVRLPGKGAPRPPVNSPLRVSGWGWVNDDTPSPSTFLMAVDIKVRKFSECNGVNESTQICAGLDGKGPCSGDSGGPLVNGDVLVGIVSYGDIRYKCAEVPSVYTYVPAFIDWINEQINSN